MLSNRNLPYNEGVEIVVRTSTPNENFETNTAVFGIDTTYIKLKLEI